ncbi:MAG: glycosyltransferase [Acidimicrobiales bacterium]
MVDYLRMAELGACVPRADGSDTRISFIVPAFSAERTLAASIGSIRAAAPPGSEVIVVDDGSLDGTAALAAQLADRVVHRPCQGGAARSRNDGVRVSRGDILFFVDADVTVTKAAVDGALAHLDQGADGVFGAYEPLPPPEVRNVATTYKNILHHFTHLNGQRMAATFWSGFGTLRRAAFLAVGGFDASVTTGADVEDIHLGNRLRAAGFEIVLDPSLQVRHHKRYTVWGMVASDIFHRAIPWTRTMLQLRSVSLDLNLRKPAILASVVGYLVLAAAAATPTVGLLGVAAAVVFAAFWTALNIRFLLYTLRHWGPTGTMASTALLFLYSLYCPIGVMLGVFVHLLRGRSVPRRNWLRLETAEGESVLSDLAPAEEARLAVSVAVIADIDERLDALSGLPEAAPWWELIVVSPLARDDLPEGARFLPARRGAPRHQMRQQALDVARGEMLAVLDADCVPEPGWLDRVLDAAGTSHVAVGGSFQHDYRGVSQRAAQVVRYWPWRPERAPTWLTEHPCTNAAFRRDVTQALGGFREEGALLPRLAGLGARPVRFDPAMSVRLAGPVRARTLLGQVKHSARTSAAASSRYLDYSRSSRAVLVALAPLSSVVNLLRIVRAAVVEGVADRAFWLALPVTAAAVASHWLGRASGLLWPGEGGGLIPRTAEDLAGLTVPASEAAPW